MASQMLQETKINSIDVSVYVRKWMVDESFGDVVRECKIELSPEILNVMTLNPGLLVTIKRGFTTSTDQFVFNGVLDKVLQGSTIVTVIGKDKMVDLIRKNVTYSYNGSSFPSTESKGSDIAEDLIETHGGMTASVIDTGTINILDKFICSGTDILGRLQVLAEIYDYQIYYDPDDDKVHFEPKGYNSNSEIIYAGGANNNVKEPIVWVEDNTQCINKVTVKGAFQEVQDEEYFDGDGTASQSWTLAKTPVVVQVWEEVAAVLVLKKPGVVGSTSGTFDYTIDKETNEITATTNWSPAGGTNNVKINYTNAIPIPVLFQDIASQTNYGVYESEKYFSDIQSVSDAKQRAKGIVNRYSVPFSSAVVKAVSLIDYEAGQEINIIDSLNNKNENLVITRITKEYPFNFDRLHVGDKEKRLSDWGKFTLDRIRRLEEENQRDTDFIVQVQEITEDIDANMRYLRARQGDVIASGFILGNPEKDILGTNTLGPGTGTATEILRVVWPNDTYNEDFKTEDFKSSTGTAIWNTTEGRLEL